MELVIKRIQSMQNLLTRVLEAQDKLLSGEYPHLQTELRDSLIKRFELSADQFWKLLKIYMEQVNKSTVEGASPRGVFNTALLSELISRSEYDELLDMMGDRNQTSHTYQEQLAQDLIERIPPYRLLMQHILTRLIIPE